MTAVIATLKANKKRLLIVIILLLIIVSGMVLYHGDQPVNIAAKSTYVDEVIGSDRIRETLFIERNGVKLEADLFIPTGGNSSKGAVIYIVGSGHTIYQNYHPGFIQHFLLDVFIPKDMAVMLINKRGMGNSTGNWLHNDFQGRADDIYAAVSHLKSDTRIDPDRIGVMGLSQGGWIANLVAAQHNDVAFFISLAGPTTTVREQMYDVFENDFICQGYETEKAKQKAENKMTLVELGVTIGSIVKIGQIGYDARIIDYNPTEAIASVNSSGLFIFGEHDRIVPSQKNMDKLEEIFEDQIPDHLSMIEIPLANHQYFEVDDPCLSYHEAITNSNSDILSQTLQDWLVKSGF